MTLDLTFSSDCFTFSFSPLLHLFAFLPSLHFVHLDKTHFPFFLCFFLLLLVCFHLLFCHYWYPIQVINHWKWSLHGWMIPVEGRKQVWLLPNKRQNMRTAEGERRKQASLRLRHPHFSCRRIKFAQQAVQLLHSYGFTTVVIVWWLLLSEDCIKNLEQLLYY